MMRGLDKWIEGDPDAFQPDERTCPRCGETFEGEADGCEDFACPMQGMPPDWDIDRTKQGFFRYHRCLRCKDGELPCVQAGQGGCEYPIARND